MWEIALAKTRQEKLDKERRRAEEERRERAAEK